MLFDQEVMFPKYQKNMYFLSIQTNDAPPLPRHKVLVYAFGDLTSSFSPRGVGRIPSGISL